jgi:Flp pilus assembly protein TadG
MISHRRPLERLRAGLAGVAGRLRRDERGAIAVQFAFLALPITILAFGLLDMNRISVQRRQLQDALDAATLIAARSTATTDAALDTTGDAAFLAEMTGLGVTLTAANSTFKAGTGNRVIGTVSVSIKPIISNLWSKTDPVVTATSEVVRSVNKLEVALVLDNTGSMGSNLGSGGTKIDALIDASKDLVDTLYAAAARASETDAVKIAVVPFSMTVNVGSTYSSATSWITGTLPSAYPDGKDIFNTSQNRFTMLTQTGLSWAGCVESRPDPYDISRHRAEHLDAGLDVHSLFRARRARRQHDQEWRQLVGAADLLHRQQQLDHRRQVELDQLVHASGRTEQVRLQQQVQDHLRGQDRHR